MVSSIYTSETRDFWMSKFLPLFLRCTVREGFPRRNVWRQKGHICLSCHFVNKRVPLCRVIVCPGLWGLSFILRPSLSSTSRPPFTITSYCWTSIRVLHKQMIEQDRVRKETIEENLMFSTEKGTGKKHGIAFWMLQHDLETEITIIVISKLAPNLWI